MNALENNKTKRVKSIDLPTAVLGIDLSRDGATAYAACWDGFYEVDVEDGTYELLGKHESYVSRACLVEDQNLLITSGFDGNLQWHDLQRREVIRTVDAHSFWSWQSAVSPNKKLVASVTGHYLAGGERYEPAESTEDCVKVFSVSNGELLQSFSHTPSVQSVAFSPDSQFVAAGNLMGTIKIWNVVTGEEVAQWNTPSFTSWGIIKSHCYIGGIYSLMFSSSGEHLFAAGMGPMRDPMAGNGKQLWQKFAWRAKPAAKADETHQGENGEGLMETLALNPNGKSFFMGGRLRGGSWNGAFFDQASGQKTGQMKSNFRVTHALYQSDGYRLFIAGANGQGKIKKGQELRKFGKIEIYEAG